MNKKAFTLVELLAVIVILALVISISIPTITNAIEGIKNNSFADTAKMMIAEARTFVSENLDIKMPVNNYDGTIIKLNYMRLDTLEKDVEGGYYDRSESYVLIAKINNKLEYYVTLKGTKRSINLVKEDNINGDIVNIHTYVIAPRDVGSTYASSELGEIDTFNITIRYLY
ncbi:MAG: type II secretion system protein [Bacilli bacterium]